jgi:hypothetical protein
MCSCLEIWDMWTGVLAIMALPNLVRGSELHSLQKLPAIAEVLQYYS